MADPIHPGVSARLPVEFPPRWGFWKGLLTGAVIEVPAIAGGVWLLARMGVGNRDAGFMTILRMTAVFAGIAALLTAGGIGRLAAHAQVGQTDRRRAVLHAMGAHAAGSAGLLLIAAIPQGHLPGHSWLWLAFLAMGGVVGAVCGAVIGALCSGTAPIGLADVWSLARTPGAALRQLLDPEDLIKLGGVVRRRTTQMFDGIFEPAKGPPDDKGKPKDAPRE
jgi:hypothetical protein